MVEKLSVATLITIAYNNNLHFVDVDVVVIHRKKRRKNP